jgi:hypothetical protein
VPSSVASLRQEWRTSGQLRKSYENGKSLFLILCTPPKQASIDHDRHPEAGRFFIDCSLVVDTSLLSSWHTRLPNSTTVL